MLPGDRLLFKQIVSLTIALILTIPAINKGLAMIDDGWGPSTDVPLDEIVDVENQEFYSECMKIAEPFLRNRIKHFSVLSYSSTWGYIWRADFSHRVASTEKESLSRIVCFLASRNGQTPSYVFRIDNLTEENSILRQQSS